jgi:hypothetical protein
MNSQEAGEYEAGQAKAAIEAAVKAGVKHIVFSTLDDVELVPHMGYKAKGAYPLKSRSSEVEMLITTSLG